MSRWKKWIIEKLGGYADIDSLVDSEASLEKRNEILTRAVRKHFNTIGAQDILHIDELGQWRCEGKILQEGDKKLLVAEATQILGMRLWRLLQADIKYQANKKMYRHATKSDDMVAGKLWEYTLDAIRTRLSSLSKGSAVFNTKEKK